MIIVMITIMQVIVHFVRQSGSYITSCFIPTAMLGLLAYSTFFIHIDDFNDRCWIPWAMFMMMMTRMLMVMMMLGLLAYSTFFFHIGHFNDRCNGVFLIIIFTIIILLGGSNHDNDGEDCQPCFIR